MTGLAEALLVNPADNVAVALDEISGGTQVAIVNSSQGQCITARERIPFIHKIAIRPIGRGEEILKYGIPIGFATAGIATGEWVGTHNVKSCLAAQREAKEW